jgi:hypothetical protein
VTQVRNTSFQSSRPSMLIRWLAVTAAALSLVVPATALGWSDPPSGISGPTNQRAADQTGLAERTVTELSQQVEAPVPASAGEASARDGFSWADAGIGAGAVTGLIALTGAAYLFRRRAHPSPRPAI